MNYLSPIKPLFLAVAFAGATLLATTSNAPSIGAQGSTYCEQNYPGDPYCHDDMDRTKDPKKSGCDAQGCHSKKAICCMPDCCN
jgi:hypothetical protein